MPSSSPDPDEQATAVGYPARADGAVLLAATGLVVDAGRIAVGWARARSLGASSMCGISVALALCATAWFSAGTRADNFRAVAAFGVGYLTAAAGRKMADWPNARLLRAKGSPAAAASAITRSRWLGALAWSMSECAIYAGLAAGAIAEHWSRVWILAVAVVGVVAVRDLMTAICRPARRGAEPASAEDDPSGGEAQQAAGEVQPATAGRPAVWRAADLVLTMPPGGRVLLVAIAAPTWGCRATLLALLDWGIISVIYGLAGQPASVARRRAAVAAAQAREATEAGAAEAGPAEAGATEVGAAGPEAAVFGSQPPRRLARIWHRREGRRAERADPAGVDKTGQFPWRADPAGPGSMVVLLPPGWRTDNDAEHDGLGQDANGGETHAVLAQQAGAALADETEAALAEAARADTGELGPGLTAGPADRGPYDTAELDVVPVEEAEAEAAGAALADETEAALAVAAEANEAAADYDSAEEPPAEMAAEEADLAEADLAEADLAEADLTEADVEQAGLSEVEQLEIAKSRAGARTVRLRDDGVLSRFLGDLVRGNFLPLPPAILGLAATAMLAHLGFQSLPLILILTPPLVMLLAAPGSSNPHLGRFDWLVPPILLGWQILYLGAIGPAGSVPGPVTFTVCAVILLRYTDLAFPGRPVALAEPRTPWDPPRERGTALGWEGRMLLMGIGVAVGIGMYAYLALAVYLGLLICAKIMTSFLRTPEGIRR